MAYWVLMFVVPLLLSQPLVFESASTNCSVGQTACDYLPGKTMCCYPGEVCIKNEGCTCFSQQVYCSGHRPHPLNFSLTTHVCVQEDDSTDSSSEEGSADDGAVDEDEDAPLNPNNSCGRAELVREGVSKLMTQGTCY